MTPELDREVEALLSELSLAEKLSLLDGDWPFWSGIRELGMRGGYHRHPWNAGVIERLGIHGVRFVDGPRGIVLKGGATTFPVTMARGAAWDPELEERIGDAIGRELQALGGNLYGGVCINLLRHPAWGRAQETYGEDPVHLGALGAALTRGVQRHAMACVKHFALNSMENARFDVDVRIAPRALHELYLPHFKQVVDAGVACVMSAYNSVNGEWCGQSRALLTDVLKGRWGFRGFVITDFMMGLRDARTAILAGQDVEMPFQMHFHGALPGLIDAGLVPVSRIDDAARRILGTQRRLGRPREMPPSVLGCEAHTALAREAAQKAIVLLRNESHALPLPVDARLAVIGRLAAVPNLGDHGSSDGRPAYVVTPLAGIEAASAAAGGSVVHDPGESLETARAAARDAEAAVVVVGYDYRDEGEFLVPPDFGAFAHGIPKPGPLRWLFAPRFMAPLWARAFGWLSRRAAPKRASGAARSGFELGVGGDRSRLTLSEADEALIEAVAQVNPRTIVVVMAGSAVITESWRQRVPGLLMLWYPGMEGGHALADVLFGAVSPSGRMPFATPVDANHLPAFDREAKTVEYDLWHGYRKLERDGVAAAFPFGFGLSYTSFAYPSISVGASEVGPDDVVDVEVAVENRGHRDAEEVVQVYAAPLGSRVERAARQLAAFTRVSVPAGETARVDLGVPVRSLAIFDESADGFVVEPIEYELIAARHAADDQAPRVRIRVRS